MGVGLFFISFGRGRFGSGKRSRGEGELVHTAWWALRDGDGGVLETGNGSKS